MASSQNADLAPFSMSLVNIQFYMVLQDYLKSYNLKPAKNPIDSRLGHLIRAQELSDCIPHRPQGEFSEKFTKRILGTFSTTTYLHCFEILLVILRAIKIFFRTQNVEYLRSIFLGLAPDLHHQDFIPFTHLSLPTKWWQAVSRYYEQNSEQLCRDCVSIDFAVRYFKMNF